MGQIKSALEKALERTADIAGDKSGLIARENREKGMKLLVRFETDKDFDLSAALKALSREERVAVVQGMRENLEGILNLPANQDALNRFVRLSPVLVLLSNNDEAVADYVSQLQGFFEKYLQNRGQMVEQAKKQYEPALRQKEDALYQQTGRRVQLQHEQDPEFNAFLNKNLEALGAQFLRVLDPIKQEIKEVLDRQ